MKITQEHIQQLYSFTQKHYVEWYDLQTELVDHLANGIERQWDSNPNLTFDEALKLEFKKFGVMGFSVVVEQKTKALNKTYWRLVWKHLASFFKLPKVLLILVLIWAYYELLNLSMTYHTYWVIIPTLTLLFGYPWYFLIKEYKKTQRKKKRTGKKWLIDQTISNLGGLVHLMNVAIYFQIIYQNQQTWSMTLSLVFSFGVVVFGMLLYVVAFVVTPKLRKDMAKHHPDYNYV